METFLNHPLDISFREIVGQDITKHIGLISASIIVLSVLSLLIIAPNNAALISPTP